MRPFKLLIVLTICGLLAIIGISSTKVSALGEVEEWTFSYQFPDVGNCYMLLELELGYTGNALNVYDHIDITVPELGHNLATDGVLRSQIWVKNYAGTVLYSDYLENYINVEDGGIVYLDMSGLETAWTVHITVRQDFIFNNAPGNYLTDWIALEDYVYDYADRLFIFYYYQNILFSTAISYHNIVPEIAPPYVADYVFVGWKTIDGTGYKFDNVIDPDWITLNPDGEQVFKLYGVYLSTGPDIDYDPDPPSNNAPEFLANMMDLANMDNVGGYSLLYLLFTLLIILVMLGFHAPILGIAILHLLLTIVFMIMDVLPVWIVILAFIGYVIVIFRGMGFSRGGTESE
jgi:hypothetical protein